MQWTSIAFAKGLGCAAAAAGLAAGFLALGSEDAMAKKPGVEHCYGGVCHRVLTVAQTARLIGERRTVLASFYDDPGVDRFNVGKYTSDGEIFDARSPARVASSNLPDGTELLLRNPVTGHASHVRVNDFGPFKSTRKLDVTRRVAEDLRFKGKGLAELEIYVITAPLPEDVVYRRNRSALEPMGHIGVVEPWEVSGLVKELIRSRTRIAVPAIEPSEPDPSGSARENHQAPPLLLAVREPGEGISDTAPPTATHTTREAARLLAAVPPQALREAPSRAMRAHPAPGPVLLAEADPDQDLFSRMLVSLKTWSAEHGDLPFAIAIGSSTSLLLVWAIVAAGAIHRPRERGTASPLRHERVKPKIRVVSAAPMFEGSVIGEDVAIEGRVESRGAVALEGVLHGILIAKRVEVRQQGVVEGQINAGKVEIAGAVFGSVQADHVVVLGTGRVMGDIAAAELVVEPGAEIEGIIACPRTLRAKPVRADIKLVSANPAPVERHFRARASPAAPGRRRIA